MNSVHTQQPNQVHQPHQIHTPVPRKPRIKITVTMLVLGIVIMVIGILLNNMNGGDFDEYQRVKGLGVSAAGTVTESEEHNYRAGGRYQRSGVEYCPVYTYSYASTSGTQRERVFTDYYDCEDREDQVTIGATATIVYDPAGYEAYVDSPTTDKAIGGQSNIGIILAIGGGILAGLSVLVLIVKLARKKA